MALWITAAEENAAGRGITAQRIAARVAGSRTRTGGPGPIAALPVAGTATTAAGATTTAAGPTTTAAASAQISVTDAAALPKTKLVRPLAAVVGRKQGRAVLPEYLRTFAGLKKNVVIAGLYSRLEIWDEEKWKAYKMQTEAESGTIAEKMAELGV